MYKDIIFCSIIIISIVILDFFIQGYIRNSVDEMSSNLNNIKKEILNKDEETIYEIDTKNLRNIWDRRFKTLATVIEHDELEKVEKNLTGLYSALESKEKSEAVAELDESIFILRHIKDKYSFKIENIF